jgi:hypothetical protein
VDEQLMATKPDLTDLGENPQETDATTAEKPLGIYELPDDDLVKKLRLWLKAAIEHHSKRRKEREREWAALANDQWEEADKTRMAGQKRTTLTLNLLQTLLAAVEGEERTNRQEIKFYGEEEADDVTAAGWNRILKWIMDQCGGEFSLSSMFRAGSAVGEGWVVPDVDFFDDPEGQIKLLFVDEDEMYWDPESTDPTGADARFGFRAQMQDEDEIEGRWQGKLQLLQSRMLDMEPGTETDGKGYRDIYLTPDKTSGPKICDAVKKQWMVVEAWWTQIEPGAVVVNETTGSLDEMSLEDFGAMKEERQKAQVAWLRQKMNPTMMETPLGLQLQDPGPMPPPLQGKERPIRRFYQAFFCGDVLLEKRCCEIKNLRRYPYVRFGAMFDKKRRCWYGLLLAAMDIQRQHNVEQSAIIQLIQQLPQASWMGPKGSFHDKNAWETKLAQPGKLLEYNASRGKPEQIETPAVPRHLVELAMSRPQQLREITGINTEMTGQRTPDAGVVMQMRKQAATTVLAPIFDNYRRAKLELGKVLLCYMQTYIAPGRRLRVIGEGKAGWVEATMDMTEGRFDLKVEEANASINDRMETLAVMQTTLPQMIQAGVPVPPEFVDLLPMNPDVRDATKRLLEWTLTTKGLMPPAWWQPGMDPKTPPGMAPAPGALPPQDQPTAPGSPPAPVQ